MKIKTNTAIKVLAPYIGQPVLYVGDKEFGGQYYPKDKYELVGVRNHDTAPFLLSLVGNYVSADKFKVILKPYTAISVEDAYAVAKIAGISNKEMKLIEKKGGNIFHYIKKGEVWFYVCQFLQSKGYDIPHYLLGKKTLEECGLAIYSVLYKK